MKKTKILSLVCIIVGAVGALVIPSQPAMCDTEPNVIVICQNGGPDQEYCSCKQPNGLWSQGVIHFFSATGPTSWKVSAKACQGGGTPCPVEYTGQFFYQADDYVVPRGKCYKGTITWEIMADGTVPTCQGSIPPTCPAVGPFAYGQLVMVKSSTEYDCD